MRFYFLLILVLIAELATGQNLKLRRNQKFCYQLYQCNTYASDEKASQFSEIEISVKSSAKQFFVLIIKNNKTIHYTSNPARLTDNSKPLNFYESTLISLTNEVLRDSAIVVKINKHGEIITVENLENLKEVISNRAKIMRLEEANYDSSPTKIEKVISSHLHLLTNRIFKIHFPDTTYQRVRQPSELISGMHVNLKIDTIQIQSKSSKDKSSGTLRWLRIDSNLVHVQVGGEMEGLKSSSFEIMLKSTNTKIIPLKHINLFDSVSNQIGERDYYGALPSAIRAVEDLKTWYQNAKGMVEIDKLILTNLDSIDRTLLVKDYTYLATVVDLVSSFDGAKTDALLHTIPAEYLLTDVAVIRKAILAYRRKHLKEFGEILVVLYRRFSYNRDYPLNVEHISSFVNEEMAKEVFLAKTSDDILQVYNAIEIVETLQKPKLSEIFAGLKFYILARLAIHPKQFEQICKTNFNSSFDNYGRYRLMIYDQMLSNHVSASVTRLYLDYSIKLFKDHLERIKTQDHIIHADSFYDLRPDANGLLLKKYLAEAYFRKAMLNTIPDLKCLQASSSYDTNQSDLLESSDLELEYFFLPKKNYTEIYLKELRSSGSNPKSLLEDQVNLVLLEPERYSSLKTNFFRENPDEDFNEFFASCISKKLPVIPDFSNNTKISKEIYSMISTGKFVFIDFWGTWCGPCVEEMPKIEEIYRTNSSPNKLIVTTIACYDKEILVKEFMLKNKYTFNVLMSDGQVQKKFGIKKYPTKLLILPNGRYIVLPAADNYKVLIDSYLQWEL